MKQIQWFPGHMFKSLREIREKIKLMDIVFVILDARLPYSSMNPDILKIVGVKPTILLFNKSDLADKNNLAYWMNHYKKEGFHTLAIDAIKGKGVAKIHGLALEVLAEKIERRQQKGIKQQPVRAIILGIPNCGKSTLINSLTKTKATKTANTPGVTKSQQWIKISDKFELLDTPGVLWPKFDEEKVGYALAITGAIKDNTLPLDKVVSYALLYLKQYYPQHLKNRYQIEGDLSYHEMVEHIALKRGAILKGNEINYERVYQIVLSDIRNNHLGGISFDQKPSLSV